MKLYEALKHLVLRLAAALNDIIQGTTGGTDV